MNNMQTIAIIQARMSSTRLPGKVLADIAGRPMLFHVVSRAKRAKNLGSVLVATSNQPADDIIEQFCTQNEIVCFRGSENDVLDRFYQAAERYDPEIIIRLTADCPLIDPVVIDKVVNAFLQGSFDYLSNTLEPTFPDGLDTEVFRRAAIDRAWREARLVSEREHVTPYIYKHPELFRLGVLKHVTDHSGLRWTVDVEKDLEFVRAVYRLLGTEPIWGINEILRALATNPELTAINASTARNEGYKKSLSEDTWIEKREDR